jgi:exonuclease VII large subunit
MIQAILASCPDQKNLSARLNNLEDRVRQLQQIYQENQSIELTELHNETIVLREEMATIKARVDNLENLIRQTVVSMSEMMKNIKLLSLKIRSNNNSSHLGTSTTATSTTTTTTTVHRKSSDFNNHLYNYKPKFLSRTHSERALKRAEIYSTTPELF